MIHAEGTVQQRRIGDPGSSELFRAPVRGADIAAHRLRQVSHDARQELALIVALIERVLAAQRMSAEQEDDLLAARRVADDLAKTLRNVTSGDSSAETADITALLRTVAVQAALVEGARVTAAVDDGLVLSCNASHARRVMLNLIENARRAAGADGWVEVRGTREAGCLLIEVEDSGPGFGAAPAGLASIGLSVVSDWLAANDGQLRIEDGVVGGALIQLCFDASTPVPAPRSQLSP